MKTRGYCFTWFNYTDATIQFIKELNYTYLVFGYEVCPTTEKAHLQGYIHFTNGRSFEAVRRLLKGAHVSISAGTAQQNREYCLKIREQDTKANEIFYEDGTLPITAKEKGLKEKKRWRDVITNAKSGDFAAIEEENPDIYVRNYNVLKKIRVDNMQRGTDNQTLSAYWIYGPPRTGKTHAAYTTFPDAYRKDNTKWWDGYQGEDTVVMDDFDKYHKGLGGYLKKWADKWAFPAENKGSSVGNIRPKRLIITSNYSINEIFGEDQTCVSALTERFNLIYKETKEQNINFEN